MLALRTTSQLARVLADHLHLALAKLLRVVPALRAAAELAPFDGTQSALFALMARGPYLTAAHATHCRFCVCVCVCVCVCRWTCRVFWLRS